MSLRVTQLRSLALTFCRSAKKTTWRASRAHAFRYASLALGTDRNALTILMKNRECLDRVADELCELETMTGDRLKARRLRTVGSEEQIWRLNQLLVVQSRITIG